MAHIPDVIISKPRKFAHDAFGYMTVAATLASFTGFMAGKPGFCFLAGLAAIFCGYCMSKIKFRWVLTGGTAHFE